MKIDCVNCSKRIYFRGKPSELARGTTLDCPSCHCQVVIRKKSNGKLSCLSLRCARALDEKLLPDDSRMIELL